VALMVSPPLSAGTCDYNFKALLEDGDAIVCRGFHTTEGETRSVLAVIPASDAPTSDFLDRLHHEYELREALDTGWAARPLDLVGRMEVAERQHGPFCCWTIRLLGQPMPAELFLRLALGLTRATRKLHQQGFIHKDITPAHVLVDQASGAAWLTGFGIATRLLRERTQPGPPELIAGTLAYMAPEQTGRMNRSIDARSDLYAPGRHFLPDAHQLSALHGFRSHGVGALPYRAEAGAALRAGAEHPAPALRRCHEAARQDR
jgi:Protein kinase domain